MGFFRRLFTSKKLSNQLPPQPTPKPAKNTKRWSFTNKTHTAPPPQPNVSISNSLSSPYVDNSDANKHAIAVAAATAAVAEAALAAAQAAAEVVRLTSGTGGGNHHRWAAAAAAVKIQSAFRGYLARRALRALRALKALVKLQALVRGHIVRKQTSDMLRRMQTLVRLQAQARENRTHMSEYLHLRSKSTFSSQSVKQVSTSFKTNKDKLRAYSSEANGSSTLKRCGSHSNFRSSNELDRPQCDSNWLDRWMEENLWNNHAETPLRSHQPDDEKSDKILEVDTWKPRLNTQQRNKNFEASQHILAASSDYNSQSYKAKKASNPNPSLSSEDVLSVRSSKPGIGARRSPFTPTRSENSWRFFGGCADHVHPNYMANTEASQAKVRAQSAPRQRLEYERYGLSKRSAQGFWDAETFSEKGFAQHNDFRNKVFLATSLS